MSELVSNSVRVVVIGSTEPASVRRVVEALPAKPGFAAIVSCPTLDAKQLSASKLGVVEVASSAAEVQPDRVFVLGAGTPRYKAGQLSVDRSRHTPAPVDAILRSVADEAGRFGVGILLGSTNADGLLGMQRMKESGGLTIAERVDGASDGHARQGLIDLVLPVDDIARQLVAFVHNDEQRLLADFDDQRDGSIDTLRDILTLVRQRTGHDFGAYKRATLSRRIARRMQVCGCENVIDYLQYVREHSGELHSLLRDFLISVTSFFRDPEPFLHLESEVVPRLFANKSASDQVRVWVAGCATGEEAYSIGMLLLEHAANLRAAPQLLVFATDIDEIALATARLACYPETIAADVPRERLERFFTRDNGQYRVRKELREIVMFSPHNLLRDPPFSRLDLISCRNLLIYLNRDAQNRLLTVFHFGLRPDGLLFLGSSESAENSQLFGPLDPRHRVFVRRMASMSLGDTISSAGRWAPNTPPPARAHPERTTPVGELHHRIVERYAPPSVLVNSELEVLHVSEHAGRYLAVAGGEPTRQLLHIVHPALALDLRTALHTARQTGSETRVVRFDDDGKPRAVEIRVRSVANAELGEGSFLVMFDEIAPDGRPPQTASIEPVVRELEDQLHRTRDQLRTTVEQYETSVEELKASNEELQAINEELRSATEELETSKEELQSVNEELTTLNHELKVNVDELSHANADLQNLMSSTDIAVLFVDRALNLKRFTPRATDLFNVIPSDLGRPLAHVTHRVVGENLSETAASVISSLHVVEREVITQAGRRYFARWLPYRSLDDRIDGVVITFVDVSELRDAVTARNRTQVALDQVEERLRVALLAAPIAILSYDTSLDLIWAYIAGRQLDVDERGSLSILSADNSARLTEVVRQAATQHLARQIGLEVMIDGQLRLFDFRIEPTVAGVTVVGFDIDHSRPG